MSATLREQIMRAAKGSLLIRVAGLSLSLLASVVLARVLGPDAYGIYAYVFALVTLFALPSQMGIPVLLVRETAKAQVDGEWARMRGLWSWATRLILAVSVCTAVVALVVILIRRDDLSPEVQATMLLGILLIPLMALGDARGAALRGLRRIVAGQLPEAIIRPALLVLLVLGMHAVTLVDASQVMALHVVAAAVAFSVGALLLLRNRPAEVVGIAPDKQDSQAWLRAAVPLALITGLQVLSAQVGIVALGIWRPEAEVGFYKVATSAAGLTLFGLRIVDMVLGPHIARLHAAAQVQRLRKLAAAGVLASTAITVPAFLLFALYGRPIISILYGADYIDAHAPLVILAAAQLINAMFGSVALLLAMTGLERIAMRWLAVSAGANVALTVALVPGFGMLGAAGASAVSILIWNIAFWQVCRRELGVDGSLLGIAVLLPARKSK